MRRDRHRLLPRPLDGRYRRLRDRLRRRARRHGRYFAAPPQPARDGRRPAPVRRAGHRAPERHRARAGESVVRADPGPRRAPSAHALPVVGPHADPADRPRRPGGVPRCGARPPRRRETPLRRRRSGRRFVRRRHARVRPPTRAAALAGPGTAADAAAVEPLARADHAGLRARRPRAGGRPADGDGRGGRRGPGPRSRFARSGCGRRSRERSRRRMPRSPPRAGPTVRWSRAPRCGGAASASAPGSSTRAPSTCRYPRPPRSSPSAASVAPTAGTTATGCGACAASSTV